MSDTLVLSGPKFQYPVEKTTLGKYFFRKSQKYGDRICQIDGTINKSETFESVRTRSTRVAIAMQKKGITANDVVTVCSPNTLDNIIPILSAFYLGAKVANLEGSLSVRHIKHLLSLSTPKMVFVDEAEVELIEQCLEGLDFSAEIVVLGVSEKYCVFSDLEHEQESENWFRPVDSDPDDVAVMFFSSGTTGLPKAICHSHYSFLSIIQQVCKAGYRGHGLHFMSFYTITSMLMLTSRFKTGHYRVFCRNPSADAVFTIIETYKVEFIFTAPILTYMLTNSENIKKYDFSSLKIFCCGGTAMDSAQFKKMNELFSACFTTLVYALSEGGLVSCFRSNDREFSEKKMSLASCGKIAPGMQLKISDLDSGMTLGPYQKGEICIKSQCIMKGYYQGDSSQVFDDDDFLKTGDVGYYDEDGYIYLIGRVKEMFKYQSRHIVPALIEAALLELPAVKEVVVVGVPWGEEGEVPAAAVVLKEGWSLCEEEIDEFLKNKVSDRERLRGGVVFVDEVKKTPTGKIARQEMKIVVYNLLQKL